SLLGWIGVGAVILGRGFLLGARRALAWIESGVATTLHPVVLAVLVPALLGLMVARWQLAAAREGPQLLGWVEAGAAKLTRAEPGPVKTEMLIRPSVLLRPRPGQPAVVELELEWLPPTLTGWVGLDDDQAQQGGSWSRHALRIEAKPSDAEDGAGE